jgi:hypothetical protein
MRKLTLTHRKLVELQNIGQQICARLRTQCAGPIEQHLLVNLNRMAPSSVSHPTPESVHHQQVGAPHRHPSNRNGEILLTASLAYGGAS